MRRTLVVLTLLAGLIVAAVPAIAGGAATAETRARTLVATLTGDGEVPPVASDGVGVAQVTVDKKKKTICYEITVDGITPTAIHIHSGVAGVNGPVVVDFGTFGDAISGRSQGCTTDIAKPVLRDIKDNPQNYYINVHTAAVPSGEIRGQLARIR